MSREFPVLTGDFIRLEPLELQHADALAAAASADPSLYAFSAVPQGRDAMCEYIEAALAGRADGNVLAYATVRSSDDAIIGATRFFDIECWKWPPAHERFGRREPDVCEIGYTWLRADSIRTAANTEAKLLMLTHAFETWQVLRVCLHTDSRNTRSQAAIERIGGKFEGILRAHRMAADFIARDSYRYSIVAADWPTVKDRLQARLAAP